MDRANGYEKPLPRNGGIFLAFHVSIEHHGGSVFADIDFTDFCLRYSHHALKYPLALFLVHFQHGAAAFVLQVI